MARLTDAEIRNAKHLGIGAFTTLTISDGLELRIRASGAKSWVVRYQIKGKRKIPIIGTYPDMRMSEALRIAQGYKKKVKAGVDPIEEMNQQAAEREAIAAQEREAEDALRRAQVERLQAEAAEIHRKEEEARLAKLRAEEEERIRRESIRTVEQVIQDWLTLDVTTRRKDGGTEIRRCFAKDVLPYIGTKELRAVTKANVQDILDRVKLRGSLTQVNHVFSDMRQFFNWCLRRELIEKSPMQLLTKKQDAGGKATERERTLSNAELVMLRDQLPAAKMERQNVLALWIQLSTIVRIGELLKAKWERIDLDTGEWLIPGTDTKNGKAHRVYLSDFAKRHFEELRGITGWSAWCYPTTRTTDTHVCPKTITRQVDDRQRDVPLQGRTQATGTLTLPGGKWTPHDLRRTGATIMRSLKISKDVIELCQNHADDNRMAVIYQRYDLLEERIEAWRVLGAHLDALLYAKQSDNVIRANFSKSA